MSISKMLIRIFAIALLVQIYVQYARLPIQLYLFNQLSDWNENWCFGKKKPRRIFYMYTETRQTAGSDIICAI